MRRDIVIIGSGFAGSLLARLLAVQGREVLLLDRDAHPRFALGESSTPLAALSLERLARAYGQPDLRSLASHGRWRRELPRLRCGLKRGFTFYRHRAGAAYRNGTANEARFLVAASPTDEVADCQWLRADLDAYLVERASAAGVEYRDRFEIETVEPISDGLRLGARHDGRPVQIRARFVVDASGAGEVIARALGVGSTSAGLGLAGRLVYAHFEGVTPFAAAAARAGAALPDGPYPDDWAAVHHLIDEGWVYSLRFDDGLVSAGLLVDERVELEPTVAAQVWDGVLSRYPTLRSVFETARPVPPGLRATGRLPRRRRRAVGPSWAMLPQTFAFFDPLFSTGIAWSLLGVERLAEVLGPPAAAPAALERYAALLAAEADQQQALLAAAYAARRDFAVFRELSFLYFACVSFAEIRQRLLDDPHGDTAGVAWRGFLGAGDPDWEALFRGARGRVVAALAEGSEEARRRFAGWVAAGIRRRNLIGLGASPTHLYGVDLERLMDRSELLGLTRAELEPLLPRLRG